MGLERLASSKLRTELEAIASAHRGVLGYAVHFRAQNTWALRLAEERFPSGSTIKLALLCAALERIDQGRARYTDTFEYTEADTRGGAGFLQHFKLGTELELQELLHLMITASDNTATAILIRWLGAMEVNDWLDRHGFTQTRLLLQLPPEQTELNALAETWEPGITTPLEMVQLLEQIADNRAASPWACEEMLRTLTRQYFNHLIARQCPSWVAVASKSGATNSSRSDVGLIFAPHEQIALALFTKDNLDQSWDETNEAELALKKLSAAIWNEASQSLAH